MGFDSSPTLAAALEYLARGWRAIPVHHVKPDGSCSCGKECSKPGKHPKPGEWQNPEKNMDANKLRWWFSSKSPDKGTSPDYNVGICTGAQSGGILYLDIDAHEADKNGFDSIHTLEVLYGPLPATLTQRTGGGGEGRLFMVSPTDISKIKNELGIAPGLDLRTSGGQFVAPPSVHASGKRYEWLNPAVPVAAAPAWFVDFCIEKSGGKNQEPQKPQPAPEPVDPASPTGIARRQYCLAVLKKACDTLRGASDGTRNGTLNKQSFVIGGLLASGGLEQEEAETTLREAAEAAGLSEEEITATIRSGLTKGRAKPLDLSGVDGSKPQFGSLVGESLTPGEWQKVICFLEKITLPKFPSECLPSAMRAYVESVAECGQVPVDLPAFLAIAVAAAAGARKYRVYIGESHDEPLNIWVISALPPGSRKTDTYEAMAEPLRIEQSRLSAIMKPAIDSAKAFQKIREKRMEHLLSQAAKEENQSKRDKLTQEYTDLVQSTAKVPSYPQLLVGGDTTPEAIAGILEDQGGKIAVMDTEGGLFSIISGRYDSKGESNLDVWLKLHAGDDLLINRKNKPPIEVSKPAGTIALTVQPGVIKDLAGKKEFSDRGLLGRFLYSIPESLIGTRLYQNKKADPTAKAAYLEAIRKIFSQPNQWSTSDNDRAPHYELFIRGNTLAIWTKFYNDIEKRQAAGGDLAGIKDWASKSASAIARIAGIFRIVETGGDPDNDEIPAETMRMACEIGNHYLIDHAKAAYGLMSMTADTHLARGILTWVATKSKDTFTATDFWADNRSKAERVDELLPGFEALVDRGILRELPGTTTGGRRAKYRYEVNPTCKSCFRCMRSAGE